VELGADVLPVDSDEHLPANVDDRKRDSREPVELLHHRLKRRRIDDVAELQLPEIALGREDRIELQPDAPLACAERALGLALLRLIAAEDQHCAADLTVPIANRRGVIGDGALRPVPRDERRVVRETYDGPLPHRTSHRVLGVASGHLAHDPEHLLDALARRVVETPSRELRCNRIDQRDPPGVVRGDDAVADAAERDAQAVLLPRELLDRALQLRDVVTVDVHVGPNRLEREGVHLPGAGDLGDGSLARLERARRSPGELRPDFRVQVHAEARQLRARSLIRVRDRSFSGQSEHRLGVFSRETGERFAAEV
jgi:hypothetical protein